jgi:hypothetical protein
MESNLTPIKQILREIGEELDNQISLEKNTDKKIDASMLQKQSHILGQIILTSEISQEDKTMLQKFAQTLQEGMDAKSLRYEKQDLERVLSNLDN